MIIFENNLGKWCLIGIDDNAPHNRLVKERSGFTSPS